MEYSSLVVAAGTASDSSPTVHCIRRGRGEPLCVCMGDYGCRHRFSCNGDVGGDRSRRNVFPRFSCIVSAWLWTLARRPLGTLIALTRRCRSFWRRTRFLEINHPSERRCGSQRIVRGLGFYVTRAPLVENRRIATRLSTAFGTLLQVLIQICYCMLRHTRGRLFSHTSPKMVKCVVRSAGAVPRLRSCRHGR